MQEKEREKELVIHSVRMVEIDGNWNIPTAVLYQSNGQPLIGSAALSASQDLGLVNEDFKIDLGRYAPGTQSRRRFLTATGAQKSASDLADDFLFEIQKTIKKWLGERGTLDCKYMVIAEPLSLFGDDVSSEWLSNYRANLRRLIEGKKVLSSAGVKLRFIPEPFAAYQYYRHGIRHPAVAQAGQMNALVIDFGGGTCDVCLIETTKSGEISGSGRNSRPLAGKSLATGGFAINREIADYLLTTNFPTLKSQIRTGINEYKQWLAGERNLEAMDAKYRSFVLNFHIVVHRSESLKLTLFRYITDWSLTKDLRFSAPIILPQDPFSRGEGNVTAVFTTTQLKDLFVNRIYRPQLKPFFSDRLKLGSELLDGSPIDVILLSGGSANIGWLRTLLREDFPNELGSGTFVQIPDFQQVVAQGLAVDCAREFALGASDFKAVTYNPLFLLLEPDQSGCEPKAFSARTAGLPEVKNRPGLLLPTASLMASFVDSPLQWKVRLNRPPRRRLDYHFLQSSLDPNDVQNRQNVEEQTVFTPSKTEFDPSLQVELTLKSNGTATPRFVYRVASQSAPELSKEGRKFFLDMTDAGEGQGEAYIGLDFGTSNTAISYIDRSWVEALDVRARDSNWKELGELVEMLPSPLSMPLAKYIGDVNENSPIPPGFSFLEAALGMLAYSAYLEFCCTPRRAKTSLFKNFAHRGAGPLWALLKEVGSHLKAAGGSEITSSLGRLIEGKNRSLIDRIVQSWANTRHELTLTDRGELLSAVRLLANVTNQVFNSSFGFFEGVQKERFSNRQTGRFRLAHGKPPFSKFENYSGTESWSEAEAVVVNRESGRVLPLTPLIFWYPCKDHVDAINGHCFFFDKLVNKAAETYAIFKSANSPCTMKHQIGDLELGSLVKELLSFRETDPHLKYREGIRLGGDEAMRMG